MHFNFLSRLYDNLEPELFAKKAILTLWPNFDLESKSVKI